MYKLWITLMVGLVSMAQAQKINEQYISFRTTLVREINLQHPTNQLIFGRNNRIVQLLLEGTHQEKLNAYTPYPIDTRLCPEQLDEKLYIAEDSTSYGLSSLSILELTEELVFDRQRSEFYFIPLYLTLHLPAEKSVKGIQEPIVRWKYEDCMIFFKSQPQAHSEILSMSKKQIPYEASFQSKGYQASIVKIGHADQPYYDQQYHTAIQAFLAMKQDEAKLLEFMYKTFNPQ